MNATVQYTEGTISDLGEPMKAFNVWMSNGDCYEIYGNKPYVDDRGFLMIDTDDDIQAVFAAGKWDAVLVVEDEDDE